MIAGVVLIVLGAVLALPQIFMWAPSLPVFWLGLLLALAGALRLADRPERTE